MVYIILQWFSGFISFQINFQKVLILIALLAFISSWTYKLKVLNKYSFLPKTPQLTKTFKNQDASRDLNPNLLLNSKQLFSNHDHFNNYLDEFLSAIRVFGFLEKPVFHELARHLQTRRLLAGDTLSLDEDKSFYIVVDGSVQVFAQTSDRARPGQNPGSPAGDAYNDRLAYDNEDDNGFQLLNVVESGGTLSSLFTILSLLTEGVKLRYEEDEGQTDQAFSPDFVDHSPQTSQGQPHHIPTVASSPSVLPPSASAVDPENNPGDWHAINPTESVPHDGRKFPDWNKDTNEDGGDTDDDGQSVETSRRSTYTSKTTTRQSLDRAGSRQALRKDASQTHPASGTINQMPDRDCDYGFARRTDPYASFSPTPQHHGPSYATDPTTKKPREAYSRHIRDQIFENAQPKEATIARATKDTTLAVIPSEAFKRLTWKFPNAVAHIVQVILARLQRVTFLTSHRYLGLTKELLRTEKAFNEIACYPLPPSFYEDGGMIRLRHRFMPSSKLTDEPYVLAGSHMSSDYHMNSGPRSSMNEFFKQPTTKTEPQQPWNDLYIDISRSTSQNGPCSPDSSGEQYPRRRSRHRYSNLSHDLSAPFQMPFSATNHLHEDLALRELVMKSIAKSIGLVQQPPPKNRGSNKGSVSHIHSSSPTPFSSASRAGFSPEPSIQGSGGGGGGGKPALRPGFRSGLGSLSYLKTLGDSSQERRDEFQDTSSSVASSSALLDEEEEKEDLPNEVEIMYFPQDSTLVKAGERNAGLYFVIDGFLDVFMPPEHDKMSPSNTSAEKPTSSSKKDHPSKARNVSDDNEFSYLRKDYVKMQKSRSTKSTRNPSKSSAAPKPTSQKSQQKPAPKNEQTKLFTIKPGGIAGYLASISGFPSYVDIRAKTDVYVGFLSAKALERIMDRRPIVLLTLAKRLISLLSPLVLHIDTALEWMAVDAGQIIYREGDNSDNLYIVIGGRLRSISEQTDSGVEILAEYGQGESIGELDCITNTSRKSTLHAIRDSELVRIPMTLFNAISIRHPAITIQVSRLIASRVRREVDASKSNSLKSRSHGPDYAVSTNRTGMPAPDEPGRGSIRELGMSNFNLKTVAIIPNTKEVPIVEFATRLKAALSQMNASTKMLDQSAILSVLGRHAFSRLGKLKLTGWLAELEQKFRIVLYVADTAVNAPWTQTCIRQADYIMVVCDGGSQPEVGEYERLLSSMKITARKELVLLHPDRNVPAGSTRPWLKNRPWLHAHHHVQMAGATPLNNNHLDELLPLTALRQLKRRVQTRLSKYRGYQMPSEFQIIKRGLANNDFARLARRLCGKSIAVVLGGGGARGISHIGVIKALQENNIPIDMIGGTSIGSFIGGLYARNSDLISTLGRAKTFSARIATYWRLLTDLTYPVVAYTTGHEFNRGIYKSFYDYHIEVPLDVFFFLINLSQVFTANF
ncbi:phosphatidylcholine and lysophosphatidylcholine phospholipase [Puccinia graminis f. sp. tritici]|uniref:Lysophospholipase NTE1 n=1 Tax=Puccinia graminis f. sp. tritici TaxID=56615 RepID=A0A5B0PJM9_PUCGR|nr:phosphatidylcholine and lysophosphatidylcholine phospholipase [Puccinia graminis f. sp. tritici]